jgi:hypothetical protein
VLPLDWDRRRRVTPAGTKSQEAWPGAEPGCESPGESRGVAPEGERAPQADKCADCVHLSAWRASAPGHRQAATFVGAARNWLDAPFGAPPPSFCRRRIYFGVVVGKPRARRRVARMPVIASASEAIQGGLRRGLDCFVAEPVIGPATSGWTRWLLAMTTCGCILRRWVSCPENQRADFRWSAVARKTPSDPRRCEY